VLVSEYYVPSINYNNYTWRNGCNHSFDQRQWYPKDVTLCCQYSLISENGRVTLRQMEQKQNVALTGRNTTCPPCSREPIIRLEAAWRHRLACAGAAACRPAVECYRRQTTMTDDRRRRMPETVTSLAPYTMCRLASNKAIQPNFWAARK